MQIDLNQVLCTKEQVTLEDLIRKFTGIDYLDEELNTQNNVVTLKLIRHDGVRVNLREFLPKINQNSNIHQVILMVLWFDG